MPKRMWVYDPQSGGKSIPKSMQPIIRQRILDHSEKHYADRCNRIDVRFRGKFCYIDAYTEPFVPPDYNPELFGGKSREERIAQLREVPTHLCRLRYFGDEENWSMAFYTYSNMKYEPCIFNNGSWHGTPEEALDTSSVYLMG
ncbi:MAG: hypothetical protein PHG14_11215 [Desulfobacter postgatei]|uniref:hypothetical protein n=1 Tax=Desulfobacter postgatei TaxID=2293 RepID=UPI0023F0E6E1|nr:hypothetical protein [Desulfobacter postgatei]MDD4274283.1 hypothetical protein [Desulfobacter postgatei]